MNINLETCKAQLPMEPHRVYVTGDTLRYFCEDYNAVEIVGTDSELAGHCYKCSAELLPAEPIPERKPIAEQDLTTEPKTTISEVSKTVFDVSHGGITELSTLVVLVLHLRVF